MYVLHLTRRGTTAAGMLVLLAAAAVLLAGCFEKEATPVTLPDEESRMAYLTELGWQVSPQPVETLDLQSPAEWGETWQEYGALQAQQNFPFSDYAGQPVRRYTYAVTNYPHVEKGVQANLYLCGDVLIGGDIIATGQGGFQTVLTYPEGEK